MRAAVLGSPVSHSLSPALHRAAYAELGLAWTYGAHDVTEDGLAGFVAALDDTWAGLSLTMPLKRAVLPLLDWSPPGVRVVGAANTIVFSRGRLLGANTDIPGMVAALRERAPDTTPATSAPPVVLGGGATAASTLAALASTGATEVVLVVRRPDAAASLEPVADRLSVHLTVRPWPDPGAVREAPLVVSTLPGGAADVLVPLLPSSGLWAAGRTLFDVAYDPWPSALASAWTQGGGTVVSGVDLLVHQAVLQVALMTGRDAESARLVPVMRAAAESALAARRGDPG